MILVKIVSPKNSGQNKMHKCNKLGKMHEHSTTPKVFWWYSKYFERDSWPEFIHIN